MNDGDKVANTGEMMVKT